MFRSPLLAVRKPLKKLFKEYLFEIIYLIATIIVYCVLSANGDKDYLQTPPELIKLIKKIPVENKDNKYCVITQTNVKTVKNILKTEEVISLESIVNINKPGFFDQAFKILKEKYQIPIFLIINSKANDFSTRFYSANINFPFEKIYEYGTADEAYTLYLFTPTY